MRKYMLPFLLLTALLTALAAAIPVKAQGETKIASMKIDLWPEYDNPGVLVIYRFTLSSDTSLPAQLALTLPATAGDPSAVAVGPTDQLVGDVPFKREVRGDLAQVTFTATTPAVQFEYYDPGLEIQNGQRHFDYTWYGDYPVDFLVIEVQQPLDASSMSLTPSLGNGERRQDGLTYYTSQVGALARGQTFSIAFDYEKAGESLTVTQLQVEPSKPLTEETSGQIQTGDYVPYALGGVGAALLVGGLLWYWQSNRKEDLPTTRRNRRRRAVAQPGAPAGAASEAGVYCHQCGKRAGPGDRFCRSCGTKLRIE